MVRVPSLTDSSPNVNEIIRNEWSIMAPKKKHKPRGTNGECNTRRESSGTCKNARSLCRPEKPSTKLLQLMLNIFNDALALNRSTSVFDLIQEVKQSLYNRDFDKAFGRAELLEAYAIRWSPSRALAYVHVFGSLPILTACLFPKIAGDCDARVTTGDSPPDLPNNMQCQPVKRVVCIGAGGGAEILALAGLWNNFKETQALSKSSEMTRFEITAIDVADWDPIVSTLHTGIITAPSLSPYASTEAKAANEPLVHPSNFTVHYVQQDMLNMELPDLATRIADVQLITLMFTLNELYSTSISATTNLLLSLTMILPPNTLLLVVDSAGSYSTVKPAKSAEPHDQDECSRKYPMQWLLDHTLLESAAVVGSKDDLAGGRKWEKLESRDSEWFRLPVGLRYPVELEDMRYQVHLYRRV